MLYIYHFRIATYITPFSSIVDYSGIIHYLEHVIVRITLQAVNTTDFGSMRGHIGVKLTSPSGTTSELLGYRLNDFVLGGYFEWPFMSVMFWGEDPTGEWTLTITSANYLTEVNISDIEFTFYGVSSTPESVASIPDECHSDCRRGCAQEGSEFCDACVNLRNAYTFECIDTCPTGYTERNGYCYDPSLPSAQCKSTLKNKDDIIG